MPVNDRTQVAEVIASAIKSEREACLFYRMMSGNVSDEAVSQKLLSLADDEKSHADELTRLLFELTGRGVPQSVAGKPEGDPDLFDFEASSEKAVLEFALSNEDQAIALYEAQAEAVGNAKASAVFRLLADTEREHADYLRLLLRRLGDT